MRLYNTLSRQEEEFAPSRDNTVRMYTCGLTVYSRGHIGNFRTFICVDVLRRTFKYICGFGVHQVMNFTDVDDRTIAGARTAGRPLREYTDQFIAAFNEDAAVLGLEPVEEMPARHRRGEPARDGRDDPGSRGARPHVPQRRIDLLPDRHLCRIREARAPRSRRHPTRRAHRQRQLRQGGRARFRALESHRARRADVGLRRRPGRPGWHIECSAMALRLLGEPPIDVHTGGVDLVFPHHENEIAQSEGATLQPFARLWVHTEHLQIDEQKMSKSLGNVYNVRDVLDQGFRPSALRYLLLSIHYRKQLKFSWDNLHQAEEALRRLTDFVARLETIDAPGLHADVQARVAEARADFAAALEHDLNTAARSACSSSWSARSTRPSTRAGSAAKTSRS